ncbi:hypothetical protein EYC84_012098 [Monilinia fructicola]|uniref:Uncharacterized protein n=1 Tax=Monilinia fructicola TaxID=38448 RepID=A0A5M9J5Y6_MONFR|nr:hypothetical protein EYC84_012098 [Monilinia fructicola]
MVGFVVGILMVFGKKEVRERIRRVMNEGLVRVKRTIGMGVKEKGLNVLDTYEGKKGRREEGKKGGRIGG